MDSSIPNLRLLDKSSSKEELDLVSEVFHRVNRIIPPDQSVLTIAPGCLVREAVVLMKQYRYSQVPVVEKNQVLGVFSYRSFAQDAASATYEDITRQKCAPGDLRVDEYLEQFEFARVTQDMGRVFDWMDRDDGVLVGTPERLIGVLTPMDFVRYLYRVASPFVMVSEIELALRVLIQLALSEREIAEAAQRSLAEAYGSVEKVPTSVKEMTFANYRSIVTYGDNWKSFEPVLGGTRIRTSAKLKEIGAIRNDLFHFRRDITLHDHEMLAGHRNWLLSKIQQAEAHRGKEAQ